MKTFIVLFSDGSEEFYLNYTAKACRHLVKKKAKHQGLFIISISEVL